MLKDTFLLLLCAFVSLTQGERPVPSDSPQSLASLFLSSRTTKKDPTQSLACFADYIEESNGISEKYGSDYNDCLVLATAEREKVNAASLNERKDIENSAEAVCTRMRVCNANDNTLDMLECHAKLGSKNTKSSYTISGNASEYATSLQERIRLVELHHEQCCSAAERVYVQTSAKNYNQLQGCLDGRSEPRPPKTTTTLLPTTSATVLPSSPPTTTTQTPPPTTPSPTTTPPTQPPTTTPPTPPPTTSTSTPPPTTTTPQTPPPTTSTSTPPPTTTPPTQAPTTTPPTPPPTTSTQPPATTTAPTPPPTTTLPASPLTTLPPPTTTPTGTETPLSSSIPNLTESPIPSPYELSAESALRPQNPQEPFATLLNL